jgi:hypothetical protein
MRIRLAVLVLLAALACASAGSAAPPRVLHVYFPHGQVGTNCARVAPVSRFVRTATPLAAAMRQLLRGPTAIERARGYGGWFSSRTAGKLRGAWIDGRTAHVDFHDLRAIIPGASSSCGSALLLSQLDRTAKQFPRIRSVVYSFEGNRAAFYEWLQRETP